MRLSVAIPAYRPDPGHLRDCLHSARRAIPPGVEAEILVVVDAGSADQLPEGKEADRVELSRAAPGLPGTWNECLRLSKGEAVHLLHQDDQVVPGFYDAALEAFERNPTVLMCATSFRELTIGRDDDVLSVADLPVELFEGDAAARFLLVGERHCCGSVVMRRQSVLDAGGFSSTYPSGPDEELYLRLSHSGVAFVAAPLYLQRSHPGQTRLRMWLAPEFADVYVRSRVEGVRGFNPKTRKLALTSSARRVCSSMIDVALTGRRAQATRQVVRLFQIDRSLIFSWRVWATLVAVRVPGALSLASRRRARVLHRRGLQPTSPTSPRA